MTQEQETVLLIRGTIASLPDENRNKQLTAEVQV